MSILTEVLSYVLSDIRTTLISLVIGFIVYKLSKFYYHVFSLPPGPIPLPFLGNLLYFRGTKDHWSEVLEDVANKYGPVFTMWLGPEPMVIVSDIDIGREVFRKNDFAGRSSNDIFAPLFSNERYKDIVFTDYGPQWEALRRVTHSAVQKYSGTEKLEYLATDCVDHTIKTIIDKEGLNKPFVPFDYIYNMFLNILAASAFGKRYEIDDPEFKQVKYIFRDFFIEINEKAFYIQFVPLYKKIMGKSWIEFESKFDQLAQIMTKKYQAHYDDYDENVIRDFCDTLITAKNEALRDGKESAPYLKDVNLAMAVFDMFLAGTDTSQMTFRWLLLHMTYNKEFERKLREEIESVIGDRMPTHEDRNRCHYCMAFISETLRISNIIPTGLQHKAVVTSKIEQYTIPAETQVVLFQGGILHDDKYWGDGWTFRPERFLHNGEYVTTKPKAFIPFSVGRRVCLGEKMAIADLFLVLVRFLQKTSEYEIVLHFNDKDVLKPDPNNTLEVHPKRYEISLKRK